MPTGTARGSVDVLYEAQLTGASSRRGIETSLSGSRATMMLYRKANDVGLEFALAICTSHVNMGAQIRVNGFRASFFHDTPALGPRNFLNEKFMPMHPDSSRTHASRTPGAIRTHLHGAAKPG